MAREPAAALGDPARALTRLRTKLAKAAGASRSDVRTNAQSIAATASLELDALWAGRADVEGPVDLIDMFSGCGGMSAGFLAVNSLVPAYRLALAVDIAADANRTFDANLGTTPLNLDISRLAEDPALLRRVMSESRRRSGHPLVLIGCAPCQGFSSHRNQAGEGDSRNNLFVSFAKIAARLSPDAIVVENVPELLTDKYWSYLTEAKRILKRSGYTVHVGVHNMAGFGVPQERFRALLLAMRRPFRVPKPVLARAEYRTVKWAIGALPPIAAGEVSCDDPMHYTAGHRESTLATIHSIPKDGGSRPAGAGPASLRRIEERQGRAAYEDVYGRLAWGKPSVTITAYARNPASGRYVHPEQDRGLSVREAALLQGFPVGYAFSGSLDERFRQVGNAVPPPFSAYLGAHMLGELLAEEPPSAMDDAGITRPVGASFARLIPALKAGHRTLAGLE